MDEIEFYLADLASRFPRNRSDYHLSYSGGKDSHFLCWFIKEYLHDSDIQIVAVNTYMEHPQISARMYKYADIVLLPKIKPTQKPVPVLKELIEIYTDPYDVVIDPVAGSGSTLRACAELNRSCYGFEIKKEFYSKAKQKMLTNIDVQIL